MGAIGIIKDLNVNQRRGDFFIVAIKNVLEINYVIRCIVMIPHLTPNLYGIEKNLCVWGGTRCPISFFWIELWLKN